MPTKIEFGLPNGAGGTAAGMANAHIRKQISEWCIKHKIKPLTYTTTRHDLRHWLQVEFDSEETLTFFTLSYEGKSFMGWNIVNE